LQKKIAKRGKVVQNGGTIASSWRGWDPGKKKPQWPSGMVTYSCLLQVSRGAVVGEKDVHA